MLLIASPDEPLLKSVLAVVVSNNPYEYARWGSLGQRHRLDTERLLISVLDAGTLDKPERLIAGFLSIPEARARRMPNRM
jgi:hypothetical protein